MTTLRRILSARWLRLAFAVWSLVGAVTFAAVLVGTGVVAWPWLAGSILTGLAAAVLHAYARRSR